MAEEEEREEQLMRGQRRFWKPVVAAAMARMVDEESKASFLVELVSGGHMQLVVAEECAQEEGLDLDAP